MRHPHRTRSLHRPRRWLAALLNLLLLHVAVLGAPGPCMERAPSSTVADGPSAAGHAAHGRAVVTHDASHGASHDVSQHVSQHASHGAGHAAAHHPSPDASRDDVPSGRSSHGPASHCLTATSCAGVAIGAAPPPLSLPVDAAAAVIAPAAAHPASISRSPEPPPPRA